MLIRVTDSVGNWVEQHPSWTIQPPPGIVTAASPSALEGYLQADGTYRLLLLGNSNNGMTETTLDDTYSEVYSGILSDSTNMLNLLLTPTIYRVGDELILCGRKPGENNSSQMYKKSIEDDTAASPWLYKSSCMMLPVYDPSYNLWYWSYHIAKGNTNMVLMQADPYAYTHTYLGSAEDNVTGNISVVGQYMTTTKIIRAVIIFPYNKVQFLKFNLTPDTNHTPDHFGIVINKLDILTQQGVPNKGTEWLTGQLNTPTYELSTGRVVMIMGMGHEGYFNYGAYAFYSDDPLNNWSSLELSTDFAGGNYMGLPRASAKSLFSDDILFVAKLNNTSLHDVKLIRNGDTLITINPDDISGMPKNTVVAAAGGPSDGEYVLGCSDGKIYPIDLSAY